MKSKSLNLVVNVIQAIIVIACGILIACGYNSSVLRTLLGVSFILLGIDLLVFGFVAHRDFLLGTGIAGGVFLSLGVAFLVVSELDGIFNVLIYLIAIAGAGVGLLFVLNSVFKFIAKLFKVGLFQLLFGLIVAGLCFALIFSSDFRAFIWLIVGVIVAVYGVFSLVAAFVPSLNKLDA